MSFKKLSAIAREIELAESETYSEFATQNKDAVRKRAENDNRIRPPFAIDRDRIMYSGAFRRYTGKTQVVYFASLLDEQLSSRSIHTMSVAQIAKTIGRFLSLNTDLIDAIALGHDLGHPPFGHDGEIFLSEVGRKHDLGYFHHNIQSLRTVDIIAKSGKGLNLTFQTRDGIISHNGEVHNQVLEPQNNKTERDISEYIKKMELGEIIDTKPSTLEGCIVRISDTIAYIGQDIEDAIRIGVIERKEIPQKSKKLLGDSNGQIIENLVNDVILQSYKKNYVCFSDKISDALFDLKEFNYKRIYKNEKLKMNHNKIENGFNILFDHYLSVLKKNDKSSELFIHFLNSKSDKYKNNKSQLIVRDFIAGMTDRYFSKMLKKLVLPELSSFENK